MGLDITAYRNIKPYKGELDEFGEPEDENLELGRDWFNANVNPDFPGREVPLEDGVVYTVDDSFQFHAGSYSGYSDWRNKLARLAGYIDMEAWNDVVTKGPFYELVCFTDCDGILGSVVCAKLAKDFAEFQDKAAALNDEWFLDRYNKWREACEMAADNGALQFH